jgi:hypothetical protein
LRPLCKLVWPVHPFQHATHASRAANTSLFAE